MTIHVDLFWLGIALMAWPAVLLTAVVVYLAYWDKCVRFALVYFLAATLVVASVMGGAELVSRSRSQEVQAPLPKEGLCTWGRLSE